MTRSDLVEELATRFSQLTHRDAEHAVKTLLDAMSESLVHGHRIEIRGFGSFSVNRRPPVWDAIPGPEKVSLFPRNGWLISNREKHCAKPLMPAPKNC
jgi:hypothetical protein